MPQGSPARISFETIPRLTADVVIFAQVPTKQAARFIKAKGTTLSTCVTSGLVDPEGKLDLYGTWILSEYVDVSKQDREWTEIIFLPPSLPTLAAQAEYNYEVVDGIDDEWPRLVQTFTILRSDYTKGMSVTAPPTAKVGTGWVRTGEKEINTQAPWMHTLFVVLEVYYTPTGTSLTSYEFDPETRDIVTVVRQVVLSSSTPSVSVGNEVDQRVLGGGWSLRTTRTINGGSAPTGYTIYDHVDFQFPALLSNLVITSVTSLDGDTIYKVNPTIRSSYRKPAQGKLVVDYYDLASPPALSSLYEIKPLDLSYSGILFSLGVSNVICDGATLSASTASDNPTWGALSESYTYGDSTPNYTAYAAAIGTEVLIVEKLERWRFGRGRRTRIYITLE